MRHPVSFNPQCLSYPTPMFIRPAWRLLLVLALSLLASAAALHAADYYVATTDNDTSSNGSANERVTSIDPSFERVTVSAGSNILSIRVFDRLGGGGFNAHADDFRVELAEPAPIIILPGPYHPD